MINTTLVCCRHGWQLERRGPAVNHPLYSRFHPATVFASSFERGFQPGLLLTHPSLGPCLSVCDHHPPPRRTQDPKPREAWTSMDGQTGRHLDVESANEPPSKSKLARVSSVFDCMTRILFKGRSRACIHTYYCLPPRLCSTSSPRRRHSHPSEWQCVDGQARVFDSGFEHTDPLAL